MAKIIKLDEWKKKRLNYENNQNAFKDAYKYLKWSAENKKTIHG